MKSRYWLLFILFTAVAYLFSCSPKLNKSVLTFFFDGVPVQKSDSSVNERNITAPERQNDSSLAIVSGGRDEVFYHYPYKEKDCVSCHDENSKSEMVSEEPGLCYACHDDFKEKYKVLHGPVSGGSCTKCHNPHEADNAKLLIRRGQQLCFYCHDANSVRKVEIHADIGDTDCMECHNAHGGDDRYMIK